MADLFSGVVQGVKKVGDNPVVKGIAGKVSDAAQELGDKVITSAPPR